MAAYKKTNLKSKKRFKKGFPPSYTDALFSDNLINQEFHQHNIGNFFIKNIILRKTELNFLKRNESYGLIKNYFWHKSFLK